MTKEDYALPPMSSELGRDIAKHFDASALRQIAEGAESAALALQLRGKGSPERSKQHCDIARYLTLAGACRSIIQTIEGT